MQRFSWRFGTGMTIVAALLAGCGGDLSSESMGTTEAALSRPHDGCQVIFGKVLLLPEPAGTCTIADELPGPTFVGNPDPLGNPACFTVSFTGWPRRGEGFAGVTAAAMQFGATTTPGLLHEWPAFVPVITRQVLTARAQLDLGRGSIQTRDVIVIDPASGTTTEQLIITGGTGIYEGATGSLVALGNSIGQPATLRGKVCTDNEEL